MNKYRDDIPERKREPKLVCWCGNCGQAIYEDESYYDLDEYTGEKVHTDCLHEYMLEFLVQSVY